MKPGAAWHERDDLWEAIAGHIFADKLRERAASEAETVADLLELEPPARILDLGCGPGRCAIPLAGLGYRVSGVDRTKSYLEEAARRAEDAGVELELVEGDMREFRRPDGFDAALSMMTSFGYFEDPAEDRRVVENVADSLADGGRFLIDTIGKEVLARIFQARDWVERDGELWLFEREVDRGWSWMNNRWIRIRDGGREEYELGHRLFSATELEGLLTSNGFRSARSYGGLAGEPYDREAERLVVVGTK